MKKGTFEKYPILQTIIEADMSNIGPKTHKFGINVKLNLLQPGSRNYSHGPRVKIFREDPDVNFSIVLNRDPKKITLLGNPLKVIKRSEIVLLLEKVKTYRIPFLLFWFNQGMTTDELMEFMQKIDQGQDLEPELNQILEKSGKKVF